MDQVSNKITEIFHWSKARICHLQIQQKVNSVWISAKEYTVKKTKDWRTKSVDEACTETDDVSYSYDADSEKYRIPWTKYPVNIGTAYTILTFECIFLWLTFLMSVCHFSSWIPEYEKMEGASGGPRAILVLSLLQIFFGVGVVGVSYYGVYKRRPSFLRVHAVCELIGAALLLANAVFTLVVHSSGQPLKLLAAQTPATLIALSIIFIPVAIVEVYFSLTMRVCALWMHDVHEFRAAVEAAKDLHKKRAMIEARKDLETIFDAMERLDYRAPVQYCSLERGVLVKPTDRSYILEAAVNIDHDIHIVYDMDDTIDSVDPNMHVIDEEDEDATNDDEMRHKQEIEQLMNDMTTSVELKITSDKKSEI